MDSRFDDRGPASLGSQRLPLPDFSALRARKRVLLDEQRSAWAEGRRIRPEELLGRWPTDPDVASVLLEDFLQRRRRGEDASLAEYEPTFPGQEPALHGLLAARTVTRATGGASSDRGIRLRLPDVGDEVFGFRLVRPFGEGAFARVFLAEQADLAGRPVVLKITDLQGDEPQTLAQLLHTHIVPIYSLHEDRRAGLRAVCMPYLGGASLSAVLARLWSDSPHPETGAQLGMALEALAAPKPAALRKGEVGAGAGPSAEGSAPPDGPAAGSELTPLAALRTLSYQRAAARLVAQLADGLHHAHQRGILHRDIKPSNILLSAEGQPLLLDFNLAKAQDDDPAQATIGGTVAYMAPEHLRALVGRTPALIRQVDRRSDIYSLGMVLAEMLTGHRPFDQGGSYSALPLQVEAMAVERSRSAPSLRRQRADLCWGLESIARKCLAPDPALRYQRADFLAEDLRRLLEDRPLKHAPELSRAERARKFLRRHPRLASSGTAAVVAALILVGIGSALAGARAQLDDSRARDLVRAHDAGTRRALCLVNTRLDLQDHLREGVEVCERTLALFGGPEGADGARHPAWLRLAPADRRRLTEDRRELLQLLAAARVRLANGSGAAAGRALALLERAESLPGLPPSRALWLDRARYYALRGETERARAAGRRAELIPATTVRDHYQVATALARPGHAEALAAAIAELDEALEQDPRHYWSLVQRGICRLERGELAAAAADFGQCIGVWPEFAWGYFNRGCALDRAGCKAAAIRDFTAALGRDPGLVPAYVNRGLTRLELKQYAPALADFERAGALGARDASLAAGRGIALEGLGRPRQADAAFADSVAMAGALPAPARARLAWARGFAFAARDPARARSAFDEALRHDPHNFPALYGRAMLAMGQGREAEALRDFERALEADPGRLEARRYRAILLARRGDWEGATREVNGCLEREPHSAATLYAACVVARAFDAAGRGALAGQALDLLERALAAGADPARAAADPDLAALRRHPRFRRLIGTGPGGPEGRPS
jgi:serine/threonine protein kinase/Tfp pilus assembly protein PilF